MSGDAPESCGALAAGAAWMILAAVPAAAFAAARTATTHTDESTIVAMVPATTSSSARGDRLTSLVLSMMSPNLAEHRRPVRALNCGLSAPRSWDASDWDGY